MAGGSILDIEKKGRGGEKKRKERIKVYTGYTGGSSY